MKPRRPKSDGGKVPDILGAADACVRPLGAPSVLPVDALQPVAGNGMLDRRLFLRHGLLLGTALSAGIASAGSNTVRPEWMREPGQPFTAYGYPSPFEKQLARRISANRSAPGNGIAMTPLEELEGIITPNGLHFERHHNGVPQIDPAQHRLMIHGMVRQPLTFRVADLVRYPMTSRMIFIECGGNSNAGWHQAPMQKPAGSMHGLVSCAEWTGVPLAILLDQAGVEPGANWVIAEGGDSFAMHISLPLEKILDDCIVALYQNGEPIRPENGYPMRLIVPGWEGVLHVKWLRRLQLADRPAMARNETGKYTELMPDGKARQFTFVMEVKSLITSPSPGQFLPAPEVFEIKGLAWSGRGRIRKVEVSADGGKSWAQAALSDPVLPRCFTRFRAAWKWDGSPAVLKSRATDETGAIQPERATLVAERGRNGYYHYNGIVAWAIAADGEISHVYR